MQLCGVRCQRAQISTDIFGIEHATDEVGRAFRHRGQRRGNRLAARRVVAAIQPQLDLRGRSGQRAMAQALHAGGPFGLCHRSLAGGVVKPKLAQRGNRSPGVLNLVRAGQVGQRQVQQALLILIDQPTALGMGVPVLTVGHQRCTKALGAGFDHRKAIVHLRADDTRNKTLKDARLFARDFGKGFAKVLLMVDRHRGDDGKGRFFHDICRIQPPAKPDLQQGVIRRGARKRKEGGAGRDLEKRDLVGAVGLHAFVQKRGQRGFGNQLPRQPDAFVEPCQMRRGIGVNALASLFHACADHRLGGPLAIGPGDVDHRGQIAFGVSKRRQKAVHAVKRQVDDLGVQGHHAIKNGVGTRGHFFAVSTASTGAGRSPLMAGDCPVNMRRIVTSSSFIALRWVTRSSMPWSKRYSAR